MKTGFRLLCLCKDVLFYLRSIRYRGTVYLCPLCGFRAKRFLDYPGGVQTNVRCPRCNSLERHRAQWLFGLSRHCPVKKQKFSVLHFAPEFCIAVRFLKWRCKYFTAGFYNDKYVDFNCDIQNMPMESGRFDIVICNHVMEHVENDASAFAEIYRVLKPGGTAFIQVPFDIELEATLEDPSIISPQDRLRLYGQEDHLRLYGRDLSARMEKAGFEVERVDYWNVLSNDMMKTYGLREPEPVFICRRPTGESQEFNNK